MRVQVTAALAALFLLATACGDDAAPRGPATPTKAGLIEQLRAFEASIRSGDLQAAADRMARFPEVDRVRMRQALPSMAQREGLTPGNIDKLAAKGSFGPLLEVFPARGGSWAERIDLDPAACYAIKAGNAEVAAHWDGSRFRLFRVDDLDEI